jgi:serine/threonine protein kinase
MGTVYQAADTHLGGRAVALKELSEQGLSPQEVAEATDAFEQEAQLLAGLHHPSLPSIYDHFTDGGRWYLVMDFIEGETLEDYLRRNGTPGLPVTAVLRLADQVAAVLEYLHRQTPPIIFRDLKPSNIMVTATDQLYLIDFGIARLFKPGRAHDTVSLGSPGYAAPEQYGTSQTTVRSDIFSFGVLLHELLTGIDPARTPFTFSPILLRSPQTPLRLAALVMGMVQVEESRRPPSVAWVRQELHQIANQSSTPQSAIPSQQFLPTLPTMPSYAVLPSPPSTAYPSTPAVNRRGHSSIGILARIGAAIAALCAVAVLCSLAASGLRPSPAESTAAAQSQDTAAAQGTLSANQSIWSSDESTLSSDENTLSSDVAGLAQAANFGVTLAAYAKDWKQMQQDYQTEQHDYQQGCGANGSNQSVVAYDASNVSYDLSNIQYDDSSLSYDQGGLSSALQQVQSDIATVQADLQALENAVVGSNGDATVTSSESAANTALASAQQQVAAANTALKSAQAQAKQFDQEAARTNSDAQSLASGMHCS